MLFQCRGWESIPRPRAYESPALPLSYLGGLVDITMGRLFCQRFSLKIAKNCPKLAERYLTLPYRMVIINLCISVVASAPSGMLHSALTFRQSTQNSGESYGICPTREELRSYPGYA